MTSYTKIELRETFKVSEELSDRLNEFSARGGYEITREGEVVTVLRRDTSGEAVVYFDVPWSAVKVARRDLKSAPKGAKR